MIIKELSTDLTKTIDHNDLNIKKVTRLFNFVQDQIRYEFVDVIGAIGVVKRESGACIDKSLLLAAVLRSIDIPAGFYIDSVKLITFKKFELKRVNHCAVLANVDGENFILDVTFDSRYLDLFPKSEIGKPNWWEFERIQVPLIEIPRIMAVESSRHYRSESNQFRRAIIDALGNI